MSERPRLGARRGAIRSEPDLSDAYKRAIEVALRWAWAEVRRRWPDVVATEPEEAITVRLCRVLNEHDAEHGRAAPGMDLFETVNRGSKVESNDGRREKQPDLVLRPIDAPGVRNRGDWGWFVECKIVSDEPYRSVRTYCAQGVARFVAGEYAPLMPSAMMLGYVRTAGTPHAGLSPLLELDYGTKSLAPGATADVCGSVHGRDGLVPPCVDIAFTHLWLDAT